MDQQSCTVPPPISRRQFLAMTSMSAMGFLVGCAANPVTGERQLMLMSEAQEIQVDQQYAPQQFSSDYGQIQDTALNNYITSTGMQMARRTHRAGMPYNFQGVNATYVNAYAFPGGSIACTRGILLSLENEAELAALLGHELGHVNARHTAERMSKSQLTSMVVGGLTAVVGAKYEKYAWLASGLGMIGAGALLAYYSRENERQADALGMEYMVKSNYSPDGMVGLMDMLRSLSRNKPGTIELMFASHPMSDERYETAVNGVNTTYRGAKSNPVYRERYMDNTSRLRAIKGAIEEMQRGEAAMGQKQPVQAQSHFASALRQAPDDYAGLVMMSKCLLAQNKQDEAARFAERAKQVYPKEAQAYHVAGFAKIQARNFDAAYQDFASYDRMMPGNPNTTFFMGLSLEGMQKKEASAQSYAKFLQQVQQGDYAQHAHKRLVEWGYIKQ